MYVKICKESRFCRERKALLKYSIEIEALWY